MLHKINQGHCPAYFNKYIEHISNTHNHNTRSVSNNNITTPACKRNSGIRTFQSSAWRLWNALDPEPKRYLSTLHVDASVIMNAKDKHLQKMVVKMKTMMIIMAKIAIMMMRLKLTVKIRSDYGMWWGAQRY